MWLEVSGFIAGDKAKEQGEDDRSDNGDNDGVNHASLATEADGAHDESADDGSNDADEDVSYRTIATALHDFTGDETRDEAYDNPPDDEHQVLLLSC